MFKCTDCGKTYSNKPEYCDCGNNVFVEFGEKKRESTPFVLPFSYFALSIFISCLILSVLTILFLGNNWVNNTADTSKKEVKIVQKNIPDIEKIWDSTPVKTEVKVEKPAVVEQPVVVEQAPQIQRTQAPPKTVSKPVIKQTKIVQKPVAKAQPKPQVSKPAATVVQKTDTTSVQKTQSSQTANAVIELNKYKTALRKALFFNLEVLTIQGQGDCVIEFNIDDSGKLINRAFYKTSDNVSVNNAVYKMMMKLPQYYPPPPSYKGEKMKLKFAFDNGSYEINYI